MKAKRVTICNKLGLHARAATKFASCAARYSAQITVCCGEKQIDGKSIMSLMLLAASKGTDIELQVDGTDEDAALQALEALIADKFGEGE